MVATVNKHLHPTTRNDSFHSFRCDSVAPVVSQKAPSAPGYLQSGGELLSAHLKDNHTHGFAVLHVNRGGLKAKVLESRRLKVSG